jgi:hypothetical protein
MNSRSTRLAALGFGAVVLASLGRYCGDAPAEGGAPPPRAAALKAVPRPPVGATASPFGPPAPAAAGRPVAAPATPWLAGDVDVCGYGAVTPAANDALGLNSFPDETSRSALAAAHDQLLSSGDEAVRAAGLLIAGQIDRLAWSAAGSADPVAYAIALEGCLNATAGAPACALLSRAQWTRLDPDNALSWLELAAGAREQGDARTEAQAMWRAAQAGRVDDTAGKLSSLVDEGLGRQMPGLPRTLALARSWQAQSAWHSTAALQADRHCAADLLADGNRRALCDALAQTLVTRGSRISDFAAGVALGGRIGWPPARLRALRQQADALAEATQLQGMVTDAGCDSVERMQGWLRAVGSGGEMQAARAILARSGQSEAWWSEQRRKNIDLAAATAAAASENPVTRPDPDR